MRAMSETTSAVLLTVVVDNVVQAPKLWAEHGLSILLETPECRLLFDTGQSGKVLLHNTEVLGVDLGRLDAVVLSHGHYDHTGGLPSLQLQPDMAKLYAHPGAFAEKFSRSPAGVLRPISSGLTRQAVGGLDLELVSTEAPQMIAPGILVCGEIPRVTDFERVPASFLCRQGGSLMPDQLLDDQALVVETPTGLVVLLGCGHAGVVNTLEHVRQLGFSGPIRALIGGLHLQSVSEEQLRLTIESFDRYDVEVVVPLHCTGFAATARIARELGKRFVLGMVGSRLHF